MKKLLLLLIIPLLSFGQDKVLKDSLFCDGHPDKGSWHYQGKLFTGVAFQDYENGKKMGEYSYKNGKYHGLYKVWYKNGQLEQEDNYKDGQLDRICRLWHENGKLFREKFYDNGTLIYSQEPDADSRLGPGTSMLDEKKQKGVFYIGAFGNPQLLEIYFESGKSIIINSAGDSEITLKDFSRNDNYWLMTQVYIDGEASETLINKTTGKKIHFRSYIFD